VLKLKDKIIIALEEIRMGPDYYTIIEVDKDAFSNHESSVMDALEKLENYLKENGALKQQLKKYVAAEKIMSELTPQLEEKEIEIEKLKIEVSDQTEETKKLHDQLNKSSEDLEETREINVILKTQFEEAKRIEKVL
jgi:chromosome segregation ATPase